MPDLLHVLHPTLPQRAPEHQRRKRANLDVERLLAQTGGRDPLGPISIPLPLAVALYAMSVSG